MGQVVEHVVCPCMALSLVYSLVLRRRQLIYMHLLEFGSIAVSYIECWELEENCVFSKVHEDVKSRVKPPYQS